jgi:hypothetical protein
MPVALDVLGVIVFVVIGRDSHDEGSAFSTTFVIAAPFLIALAVAWLTPRVRHAAASARAGWIVAATTVALGLALRRIFFNRGIAIGFIIVTTIVLGGYLVAWRAIARRFAH